MKMGLPTLALVCFPNGVGGPGRSFSTVFIRWTCAPVAPVVEQQTVISSAPFFLLFCEMMDGCVLSVRNNNA